MDEVGLTFNVFRAEHDPRWYSNVRLKKTGRGTEIGQRALRVFLNRDVKFRPSGTEILPELRVFLNRDVDAMHQFF